MRICSLSTRNYRTLENLDLSFTAFYSALCGRNDSGKSNVVRAVRHLMREENDLPFVEEPDFSFQDDLTKWVNVAEGETAAIEVSMTLAISPEHDSGLHAFVVDYLGIRQPEHDEVRLEISLHHRPDDREVTVSVGGERFTGLKAQEILKRLQTSRTFLFHSSTEPVPRYRRSFRGTLGDIPEEHSEKLEKSRASVDRVLRKIARDQQEEIEDLLGRLNEKYRVGLSIPKFDLRFFPYNLTLGDRKVEVELDEWGSGTRNRTMILLTLFRARQISQSQTTASKVTPVIVIEEPESFLHPSAQAEFGRVLQDLAGEFRVQVIVTTHSPYLLSHDRPDSNILLTRRTVRRQMRETIQVDTSGDNWTEPFSLALGLTGSEIFPWQELFFNRAHGLLLVEGETDKEYFELLRDSAHGEKALDFEGQVFAYGGKDVLKNQALLRFLKDRFDRIFVTVDLDALKEVEGPLKALGFEENKTLKAIGVDKPGRRAIEGILPERIRASVLQENTDLVEAALNELGKDRMSARSKLKKRYLEKFRAEASPGEDFAEFYKLTRLMNKALGAD